MVSGHMRLIGADGISLRTLHETVLPKLAREFDASGDYYEVLIRYLEWAGEKLSVPEFRIVTDVQLLDEVKAAEAASPDVSIIPKAINRLG